MDELREALAVHEAWLEKEEINELLVPVDDYGVTDILKNCQSLVRHDAASGIVRFAHPTVQLFLEGQDIPRDSDLAMTCITFLGFDEFARDRSDIRNRLVDHNFYSYAARFWAFHTKGEAENYKNIQRALVRLLSAENKTNSMLHWQAWAEGTSEFTRGQTWLHILANVGLETVSKIILERDRDRKDRYVLSATLLKVPCTGHIIQY